MSEETTRQRSIWENPRRGFRVMWWDPVAAILCGLGVWSTWDVFAEWALIPAYVLGTFFLFCNVFRVRRNAELFWAATFLANALAWLYFSASMVGLVVTQTTLTLILLALEVRSPGYRGILS